MSGVCRDKVRYRTWADAEADCLRVMAEGEPNHIEAYRCPFCHLWHFGHPPNVAYSHPNDPVRGQYIREKVRQ